MDVFPKPISKNCTKQILNQLDKSLYNINNQRGINTVGFFSFIKYKNKNIPVLITTYEIINEDYLANNNNINISTNDKTFSLDFGEIKYINKNFGLSVIEIKNDNNNILHFLEIDDILYQNDSEFYVDKETIYIIHRINNDNNNYVTYGRINYIHNSKLICSCNNINFDSNTYPIFNCFNNKIIGIYKNNSKNQSGGILFKFIINDFIDELKKYKKVSKLNYKNEISIELDIDSNSINKPIYFFDNYKNKEHFIFLNNLNDVNTEIYINNDKYEFKNFFIPLDKNMYNIKIKFRQNITDASYMFAECENIKNIDFISFIF